MTSSEERRHGAAEHISEAIDLAKWWNQWLRWKAGRRGTFLGILAAGDISYGLSLILGFHPISAGKAPLATTYIAPFSLRQWGFIWIACGIFLLTGVLAKNAVSRLEARLQSLEEKKARNGAGN